MDMNDVRGIAARLIDFHLMDPKRKIVEETKIPCNFVASNMTEKISFDLTMLNFLNKEEVLWNLLHEEGHLIFNQETQKRQSLKLKIWCISMIALVVFITVLFAVNSISLYPYYSASLMIAFIIVTFLIFYADKHYYYQPYWNDEFRSDEYAVKGLFIIDSSLIPWQLMYSSFQSFKKCRKAKKISRTRRLYLKLFLTPHPPDDMRIHNVRVLFNKYQKNRLQIIQSYKKSSALHITERIKVPKKKSQQK